MEGRMMTHDDRADYIINLIAGRCPEVTDADLALITSMEPSAEMLPVEIGEQIMDVLEAMEAKQDQLVASRAEREAIGDDDAN
jgi:hypothetical protein